jgi:hypothetical protein
VKSNTVADGLRTVELSRLVVGKSKDHFNFPTKPGSIDLITAVGNGKDFAYHKARTVSPHHTAPSHPSRRSGVWRVRHSSHCPLVGAP